MNNYVTNANATTLMTAIGNKIKETKTKAIEGASSTAIVNSSDIALTDSTDARVHDLKIYGKTEDGHSVGENGLTVTACGKNIFNGQWLAGKTIDNSTGKIIDTSEYNRFVSVDIRVNPLTTYFGYNDSKTEYFNVHCYDENLNWLGSCKADVNNNTFTTLANTAYIRLRNYVAGTRGTKWAIYVSDPTINGQYIPYVSSSLNLSTALPLRGSYKTVDLGSLNWYYETEYVEGPQVTLPRFAVALGTLSDAYIPSVEFGVAMSSCSSRYTPMLDPYPEAADKFLFIGKGKGVYIVDHDYTDPAAFKAAVTGITLTYPSYCDEIDLADGVAITRLDSNGDVLATPVTTPLSDAEKAAFAEFRTFDGNTNVTATDNPFMSLTYVKNTDNGKALADVDDRIKDTDVSGKADKVSSATANNFAALDANGNLKDSGKKASDFVEAVSGKGLSTEDYTTAEKTKLASLSPITISPTLTLTVAGWDSTTKQQTVLTTIDTTKRNVVDITVGELPTWSECNVYAISESATGVTFQCDTIPSDALTFKITSMVVTSNA